MFKVEGRYVAGGDERPQSAPLGDRRVAWTYKTRRWLRSQVVTLKSINDPIHEQGGPDIPTVLIQTTANERA